MSEEKPPNGADVGDAPSSAPPPDQPPPPSSYSAAPAPAPSSCSYVDFCPLCLKQGGFASMPTFERFDVLLGRANQWLVSNPAWKVINCETVESKADRSQNVTADTVSSTYYESGKMSTVYNRSLRLWIANKTSADNPAPQQIGYLNIVPACLSAGGFLKQPQFENFAETMSKFNQMIAQNPIPGRVINMETQEMKFESWTGSVDPESCIWIESGKMTTFFLNIIRIFYEAGSGTVTSIGTADFVPAQLTPDKGFTMGTFELLGATVSKANAWIAQQPPGMNVVNVQSLEYKIDRNWGGSNIDTMRSLFYESGKMTTFYLRIIRAYWTQGTDITNQPPRQTPLQVTYRTFMPAQLTTGTMLHMAQYENQVETMKRALAWVNATGAKVISAETVQIRYGGMQNNDSEVTYSYASGKRMKFYVIALRLFLDGAYVDPPPEAMPPVPQITVQESGCACTVL